MAKGAIVVTHQRMATTARYGQVVRGVEHLYYSLLFVTPAYGDRAQKWSQWLEMGFGVNIRQHPTAATRADQLRADSRSDGPRMTITVKDSNDKMLAALQQLVRDIDGVRVAVHGKDEKSRRDAIKAAAPIKEKLLDPVAQSMRKDDLDQNQIDQLLAALTDTLVVLTEDNVASIA